MALFHLKMRRVCAEVGRNTAQDKSAYINRTRERDIRVRTPVTNVSTYMRRQEELEEAQGEVLYSELLLPPDVNMSRDELWDAVDRRARRKDGEYSRHAGHMPCLAIFCDASLPWGLPAESAITATRAMALWLVDNYGCAVEVAIHCKEGRIDHAHFLFPDRVVSKEGIGSKIRSMNGIADRTTEVEGGRRVSSFAEATRAEWARLTRVASGIRDIDHRSFQRQGKGYEPCPDIPRGRYEYEQRHGLTTSLDARRAMLAARAAREVEKEQTARKFLASLDRPFSFQGPRPPRDTADTSAASEEVYSGRMSQQKPSIADTSSEIHIPTAPKTEPFPRVDIQITLDLAGGFGISITVLECLRRELRNCTDPYVYPELLRKLKAEEERVQMLAFLESRRREETQRQLAMQRRVLEMNQELTFRLLQNARRSTPQVQTNSISTGLSSTTPTSPDRRPEGQNTFANCSTTPVPSEARTRAPSQAPVRPPPEPASATTAGSPLASRPVPTSSPPLPPDQKLSLQQPTKDLPVSDGHAPARASTTPPVRIDLSGKPASRQTLQTDDTPHWLKVRESTVIYASALLRLRQLTPDNLRALAKIAGVSTQVLEQRAKGCYVQPGRTPQESIEGIIAAARKEGINELIEFHEARVQLARPPATLARGTANKRGPDGRDR